MDPFFVGLWRSVGASWELLGPPKALLGRLWTSKTLKNLQFFKVFVNACFSVLEAVNGPLGLILAPSWADLVPK